MDYDRVAQEIKQGKILEIGPEGTWRGITCEKRVIAPHQLALDIILTGEPQQRHYPPTPIDDLVQEGGVWSVRYEPQYEVYCAGGIKETVPLFSDKDKEFIRVYQQLEHHVFGLRKSSRNGSGLL